MTTSVGRIAAACVLLAAVVSRAETVIQASDGARSADLLLPVLALSSTQAPEGGAAATPAATPAPENAPPAEATGADTAALDALDAAVKARRERLTWHQVAGFSTEALHLGALAFSILDDYDRFGGGSNTGRWKTVEVSMVGAAAVGTGLTFTLAALAPQPFEREPGIDSNLVHRILMFTGAGLNVAKLALSLLLYNASGYAGNETLVSLHRVTTYTAPAFYMAGALIQVF